MLIKERGGGEFGLSGTDLTSYSTDFYIGTLGILGAA